MLQPIGIYGHNVLLFDPLDEYKVIEKEEMQGQKDCENKIQNRDAEKNKDPKAGEQQEENKSQKAGSEINGAPKKKKAVFEDVTEA